MPCLVVDACGGYIDASNGTIQSPLYPDFYPPSKNCIWLIVAPTQYRITITFHAFDIEGNNVSRPIHHQSMHHLHNHLRNGLICNSSSLHFYALPIYSQAFSFENTRRDKNHLSPLNYP